MLSIDDFYLWIDRENMWDLQKLLALWAFACCLYASAKLGRKINDKIDKFLSGLSISPKISLGISWALGQLGMIASMVVCFYAAMAFGCSKDNIINIKAGETLAGIMSFPEEQRTAVFAKWLKDKANWKDWQ